MNSICTITITVRETFFTQKSGGESIKKSNGKIFAATEACLLVSNLYSTSKTTRAVPNDDMKKIVKFVQLQLRVSIFPSYDRFFAPQCAKDKIEKTESVQVEREVRVLYAKLVDVIKNFITIFGQYSFNDSIVFSVLSVSVKSLFVHNIAAIQLVSLRLITTVNQQYEK